MVQQWFNGSVFQWFNALLHLHGEKPLVQWFNGSQDVHRGKTIGSMVQWFNGSMDFRRGKTIGSMLHC